ncbi:MAG: lysine--tRNA ligase [Erysipelotrichaceae bacterium]|nr:lysine--tRNA ligase [Erysipelotrichaceae bacterium]
MAENLTDQELVRRQKMEELRAKGIDPFGHAYTRTHHSRQLQKLFGDKTKEELEEIGEHVSIAGRIMSKRRMGKIGFMHLLDRDGQIQVVVNKGTVGDNVYEIFKASDIGDIIGIEGNVVKTDSGELSVKADKYTHLSKALRPLPEKFHGLTDKEERFRRRYVDLIMNEDARRIAFTRPKIIRSIQRYFDNLGLIEVETPVLNTILGGANARPFVTHHNTLDVDMYLRIATELPLKRLIVGGLEGVYEIGRLFRNEGMDTMHNPEFTTIEFYVAYSDMYGMMDMAEGMFETVATEVLGTTEITYQGKQISLKGPFKRVTMVDAIKEYSGVDFHQVNTDEEAIALAKEHEIELLEHEMNYGHVIEKFFDKYVEEHLIQPTFVYSYPLGISPLAKKNADDPRFTDRFELFIDGHEYGNAFSELNDPIDQKARFQAQVDEKNKGNDEATEMDIDYVEALEYGLPPTGGMGIGIDRLVMLLTDADTIREVLLFPTMKPIGASTVKRVAASPARKPEIIDFSNVEVEPLFEDQVDFETFSKSDFRVVKVKDCTEVPKSKKLLQFVLDDGSGTDRIILSGIKEYYEPEELIGKTCVAIVNLPPRKMMGIDSCGMLISAVHSVEGEKKLNLLEVDPHIPAGAKLY